MAADTTGQKLAGLQKVGHTRQSEQFMNKNQEGRMSQTGQSLFHCRLA